MSAAGDYYKRRLKTACRAPSGTRFATERMAMDRPASEGSLRTPKCWVAVHLTNGSRMPSHRRAKGHSSPRSLSTWGNEESNGSARQPLKTIRTARTISSELWNSCRYSRAQAGGRYRHHSAASRQLGHWRSRISCQALSAARCQREHAGGQQK
jgi:hypothetical protein